MPLNNAPLPKIYVPLTLPVALKLARIKSLYVKLALAVSTTVVGLTIRLPNSLYLASVMSRKYPE